MTSQMKGETCLGSRRAARAPAGQVEPHGFTLLRLRSLGYEGQAAVVPLVSSAKAAEPTPP
jgi:hypothetical protein